MVSKSIVYLSLQRLNAKSTDDFNINTRESVSSEVVLDWTSIITCLVWSISFIQDLPLTINSRYTVTSCSSSRYAILLIER